jgi:predicted XRE-type DNA-binding protein
MLSELKINQASTSVIHQKKNSDFSDTDSISSHNSTSSDIKILEENFGKINLEPKLQRIFDKSKPVNFAKNWYSRPTPPDLHFEERFLQSQFSISSDKLYEWNIEGLSEQELMNKMNHMSMVANAYNTNQNLSQSEIVDLLAIGFSGTLRNW